MLLRRYRGHSKGMLEHAVPVKVFIADDSALIRDRVADMLDQSAMLVVGQSATPMGAIDGILATHPDVVVLDVQLRGGTGLQVLQAVHRAAPEINFVVFSNNSGPAYRKCYLDEGAAFFLDKNAEFDQLVTAISAAFQSAAH
jgi:DNA-binding NarL/FixJ family response regulator